MNKHEEMQKYFAAIIKIAESNNEETCQAIQRVCIDASNFFERNFTEQEKEEVANEQTTVQNELRLANTVLFESFPYQILSGIFLVVGTIVLSKIKINELAKIAVVLVINNMCYALANFIFAYAKHFLRLRLCKRLGIEPTERHIAVMESMEYQSV